MNSPICPYCSCSLARLEISREQATRFNHGGQELLFCCQGCLDAFQADPSRYLAEIEDWIVCPTCLAEKPRDLAVSIEHEGELVYFCRCPHCLEQFDKEPGRLLARLAV